LNKQNSEAMIAAMSVKYSRLEMKKRLATAVGERSGKKSFIASICANKSYVMSSIKIMTAASHLLISL
jgi:hypothetical protein